MSDLIYIYKFDNAIIVKHQSILLFWYLDNFLGKDKTGLPLKIKIADCMIIVYRADQLKRLEPPLCLKHLVIESKC